MSPNPTTDRTVTLVEVYDSVSGDYLGSIPAQETGIIYMQFNATGELLTTVTVINHVVTWDLSTLTKTEPSLPGGVFQGGPIAWNPHDNRLAASLARVVYITSPDSPDVMTFGDEDTTSTVLAMDWSPDGDTLAISTAIDGAGHVTLWDVSGTTTPTEPTMRIVGVPSGILDWKPDGTALAARTDGGVVIYDSATGETLQTLLTDQRPGYMYEVQWSPDRIQIAVGANNDLWIWDVATGAILAHDVMPQDVTDIAWLPDGQVLHNGGDIGLAIDGSSIEGYALPPIPPIATPTPMATPLS